MESEAQLQVQLQVYFPDVGTRSWYVFEIVECDWLDAEGLPHAPNTAVPPPATGRASHGHS